MAFAVRRPRLLGYLLLVYGAILVAYLPYMPSFLHRVGRGEGAISFIVPPEPMLVIRYLKQLFGRSWIVVLAALALYAFLALRSLYDLARGAEGWSVRGLLRSPGLLLSLWLVVPFAGAYVISLLWTPTLVFRYLIISFPAAYLLLARAVVRLPLSARTQGGLVAVAGAALLVHLVFSLNYYSEPYKAQIREGVRFVAENERPSALVAYCAGVRPEYFDYYLIRHRSDARFQVRACETATELERTIERGDYNYVLFVEARSPREDVVRYLHEELNLVREERYERVNSYLFEVV